MQYSVSMLHHVGCRLQVTLETKQSWVQPCQSIYIILKRGLETAGQLTVI